MEQKRFLIALVLSGVILFGWDFALRRFYPPQSNVNAPEQANSNVPAPEPTQLTSASIPKSLEHENLNTAINAVPQRVVIVSSPLYEIKIDTRGAIATSWVIKKNKDTGRPIYSIASRGDSQEPLELIPSEEIRQKQGVAPLLVLTGDSNLDTVLASKNYTINGVEGEGEVRLEVQPGDAPMRVEFKLHDDATGLDVTKTFSFTADHYSVSLGLLLSRGGQPLPNVKLAIGPSIGDQGVPHYTFYSVAPEGVASVDSEVHRFLAASIHNNENGWFTPKRPEGADRQIVNGGVDWAAVGDTYFAMAAVLPKKFEGLEFRTAKYEKDVNGSKEERYLITGFVPVPSDGSAIQLYSGPKDHYVLNEVSAYLTKSSNRDVDLDGLIDYGLFSTVSRPIAVQILRPIKYLNNLTGSYGIAIIIFTIILYSLFFPLKWRSSKSMKKAQKLAPRMKEIQEKIKALKQNDPRLKDLQMEQLRLMKDGNPLGGCLPLLIQMPFLFALFRAITISIDFRQATFLWMPDLSAADPLHILPFLMAGSMVVLQLITPAPSADPLQRKMMAVVLPVMMLYMMWSAPAGLLVYWFVGNIVGFGQQILINKLVKSESDEDPPKTKAEVKSNKKLSQARVSQA